MSAKRLLNVPAPPGSRAGVSYARIIPAEELGDFASWQPGAFGTPLTAGAKPPAHPAADPGTPAEPTAEEWRAQVAEARKAGYQDGYRDGLVGLENFKQAHATQLAAQIGQLLQSIDHQWHALEPRMAESVAQTAVRLARRVLRQELQVRPEAVVPLAQEAVQALVASARRVELRVHPEDLPLVQQGAGELLEARGARLVGDKRLTRGGCRVLADLGSVEATLEHRWAEAAAELGSALPWSDPAATPSDPSTEDTAA